MAEVGKAAYQPETPEEAEAAADALVERVRAAFDLSDFDDLSTGNADYQSKESDKT